MQVHSIKERWGEIEGVYMFLYTHIVFRASNDDYFTARLPAHCPVLQSLPPSDDLALHVVDPAHVWPPLEPAMTVCDDPDAPSCFVKRPVLVDYCGTHRLGQYVLHEARVCHALRRHPHPNLALFRGCAVGARRQITGLCFDRYAETLADRLRRRRVPVDPDLCLAQIRAALRHLHALNLVHNDITPDNVMFRGPGPELVIIDYDCCAIRGYGLPEKHGPAPKGASTSEFANDLLGLDLIRDELLKAQRQIKATDPTY